MHVKLLVDEFIKLKIKKNYVYKMCPHSHVILDHFKRIPYPKF